MFTEANKKFTATLFAITAVVIAVCVCVTVIAVKVKSGQNVLMGTIISFATLAIIQMFIVLRQTSGLEQRELIRHKTEETEKKVDTVLEKIDTAKDVAAVAKEAAATATTVAAETKDAVNQVKESLGDEHMQKLIIEVVKQTCDAMKSGR